MDACCWARSSCVRTPTTPTSVPSQPPPLLLGVKQPGQDAYHPSYHSGGAAGSGRLRCQEGAAPVALPLVIQCQVAGRVAGRGAITAGTTGGLSVSKSYSKKGRNLLTCTLSEDLFFKGAFKVCAERVIRRCDRASRPSGLYMHKAHFPQKSGITAPL